MTSELSILAHNSLFEDREDDMSILVQTADPQAAAAALEAAVPRLGLVTFDGHEYGSEEAWQAADTASGGSFETTNANFVSDVEVVDGGAQVWLDTKGVAPGAMGRTVIRIVTEELLKSGVTQARLLPA